MFIDARKLPNESRLTADLAIIGAGPAGITLARSMVGRATQVCLIEAGDIAYDGPTQALYEGENVGIEYPLNREPPAVFWRQLEPLGWILPPPLPDRPGAARRVTGKRLAHRFRRAGTLLRCRQ
jgi:choline dehydrogenase-like flavoprotein